MKIATLTATGLLALTGLVTPATAQRAVEHHRVVEHHRTVVHERHDHRGPRARQVCRYETRHHHRVRVCRTVRYR